MKTMRIRELREQLGITQRELGARMGVDCTAVTKWETEVALPRARQLPRLAQVLGCSIDELYTHDEEAG